MDIKKLVMDGKSDEEIKKIISDNVSVENENRIKTEFVKELRTLYQKYVDELFDTGIYDSQESAADDIVEIVKDTKIIG